MRRCQIPMADYAPRRLPLDPDDGESANGDEKLEELRHLIIAPEQEELARLHERVVSPEQRTRDVSEILPEAILRSREGSERALGDALAPSVESALRESVRKNPGTLADALFPVMGPAIRRSIIQTLRGLFDSFNQTMEQSLSLRGLQWRFEAIRTGRPFSEVVLVHSLLFRVEQVFLIHKKTGLPLAHASAPSVAMQDPSLVSGMLSAIQSFVHDSFNSPQGEGVEKLNVGEQEVWVEEGPYAIIAAVIRGMAPPDLRSTMIETLEQIHRKFGAQLERFQGETAPFAEAADDLAKCLDYRFKEKPAARPKPYIYVFAGAVLLVLLGWFSVRWWQNREWSQFVDVLRQQPGIVVTSFGRQGGHFVIRGLRDPLATDPQVLLQQSGLDARRAEFHWAGYYALDDAIIQQRATTVLRPPAGVKLSFSNGVLSAEGEAPGAWTEHFRNAAPLVPGVRGIDTSKLAAGDQAEFDRLKDVIQSAIVKFPVGSSEIPADELESLRRLTPKIEALFQHAAALQRDVVLDVIGHSDSTGQEATNRPLSRNRADRVRAQLTNDGLLRGNLQPVGVATAEPLRSEDSEEGRQFNRSVTFRIAPRGAPPS